MKIIVHNTRSKIETDEVPKALIKEFTKKPKDAFWAARHRKGWGGAVRFVSPKMGLFATGLLPLVTKFLDDDGYEYEIEDRRTVPAPQGDELSDTILNGIVLRDYQLEAVKAALESGRGIIKAPTGSGKTAMLAAIIKALNLKTLVIVDRVNLASQIAHNLRTYGIGSVGVLGGKRDQQDRQVVISTIQSAAKLKDINSFEVVIADETHHTKAKTYLNLLKNMEGAYYRFGLSGTPFSDDEVDNYYRMAQFGPIVYEISTATLVNEGILSKPTIRMIEINEPLIPSTTQYQRQYELGIANNVYRNDIIARLANGFRGKVLILFRLIQHGQELKKRIPKALYVDGDTDYDVRDEIFKGFNRTPEVVLIASSITDEGIDFSSINHLIIAGGEKSYIKTIQRLGRGLRSGGEGDVVNVIDFYDRTSKILEKHSKQRKKIYEEEGHEVVLFKIT